MITIDDHSFEETLLPDSPKILDGGCRGFVFSRYFMTHYPHATVIAVDADPAIIVPNDLKIHHRFFYCNNVLSNSKEQFGKLYVFGNGSGNYISSAGEKPRDGSEYFVPILNITSFYDLIKLDIEGSEGELLMSMGRPLATQISVEFHQHCFQWQTDEYIENLFSHCEQWYTIHNKVKEKRHGCSSNYWDVLMILK